MKQKHLTAQERELIVEYITNGFTKSVIARNLNKEKSTIGKEIQKHRFISYTCPLPLQCSNYRTCKHLRKCNLSCPDYVEFKCKRRDISPGACNGCEKILRCRFTKYKYSSSMAQKDYLKLLKVSRSGIDSEKEQIDLIANIIVPLIKNGQSIYTILQNHPEIKKTEKTIYNYIYKGVFRDYGLLNIDLRASVKRKPTQKVTVQYKKRKDFTYLIGRTYKDYKLYIQENPMSTIVQMDTVYNDISNGPFIQTFKFIKYGMLFAILHDSKTKESMNTGIDLLENILGHEYFRKYVNVLLTDRGSEFCDADYIEKNNRTKVYYCDPMQSCQKGSLENNHLELRYILPKEKDLKNLGLTTQEDLNLIISHINSVKKEKFDGKSPLELIKFFSPELFAKFKNFGINIIEADDIVLIPKLIKK